MSPSPLEDIGMPFGPVSRFQPYLSAGSILSSLDVHPFEGSLILDTIGACPQLLRDLSSNGNKILTCVPNPVDKLLQKFSFSPPNQQILRSVFAEIAASRYEGQRLELHLQEMMKSICGQCGKPVYVEKFTWSESKSDLLTKTYNCSCGNGGEYPVEKVDIELAAKWERSDGLYRSAAEAHFDGLKGIESSVIRKYFSIYTPRVLHSLDALANRIHDLFVDPDKLECAQLLLLFAADRCSGMWNAEEGNYRPKLVQTPPNWPEKNVWMALTEAYNALFEARKVGDISSFPELPTGAGVSLYSGSFRDLLNEKDLPQFTSIVTVLPRPSQAYWVLSALWSRWILDCPPETSFLNVLRRRRFDWAWYTEVLVAMFTRIRQLQPKKQVSCNFIITEPEPEFIVSAAFSLARSGYDYFSIEQLASGEFYSIKTEESKPHKRGKIKKYNGPSQVQEALLEEWKGEQTTYPYIGLVVLLMEHFGKNASVLTQITSDQITKDLQQVLEGPLFEDVANRSSVETGIWRIRGSISQGSLQGI